MGPNVKTTSAPAVVVPPEKAALVKALQERIEELQKQAAAIRDTAAQIPRELTESEKRLLAENAEAISTAQADSAALVAPTDATYDERIKELQKRRAEVIEQSNALRNLETARRLTDDERRRLYNNGTVVAEIDHQIDEIERQKVRNLAPAERVKVLQKERDALAQADADAQRHLNAPAIANLDTQIANAKAEIAAAVAAPAQGDKP